MTSWRPALIVIRIALAIAFVGVSAALATAGDRVAVFLRDGRILTGEVDVRTTDSELWLHSAEPAILIVSATPWSDISGAKVADRTLATDEFRKQARELTSPLPVQVFRMRRAATPNVTSAALPAVQSIEIIPELSNWRRGVATDGLELRLQPLAADRSPVPAEGIVTIRLLGRRLGLNERLQSPAAFGFWNDGGTVREYSTRLNNHRYIELGRWSERVSTRDLIGTGYLLRLPFRNVNPEYDLDVALDGMVDVRFSVDGQGIHEATAPLQLRTFSPFREELQLNRGTRFLPDE